MSSFSTTHWIIFAAIVIVVVWGVARFITSAAKMGDYWKERGRQEEKPPK